MKNLPANAGDARDASLKIPWRRKWQPAPVFLPGKSHGQRSLAGYSPWNRKESDMTEQAHVDIALRLSYMYNGITEKSFLSSKPSGFY